ncbi:MAG: DnaT-like ssDNA-binding domain-containing protein [Gammaproteobacteria bacterium]
MTTSLIPERPLLISPTLAATIGLEEAVMLHVISELLLVHPPQYRQQRRWGEFGFDALVSALPFWQPDDIRRVQRSLQGLGLLLVEPVPGNPQAQLYAINQPDPKSPSAATAAPPPQKLAPSPFQSSTGTATLIPPNWQPDPDLYRQCQQRNIPRDFVDREVPGFVLYYRDRRKTDYSWNHSFLKWVVAEWEKQRSAQGAKEQEAAMSAGWLPEPDAVDILEHAGISRSFIEDAIPEFILYWRERGTVTSGWSSKFIAHVRRQWERYTNALENDTTPRPIPPDFTPSPACLEVIALANIDVDFALARVKEFILYWQDRREVHGSWNTRFWQHVKYQWTQQTRQTTAQPILDKLTDRSWAEG